MKSARHSTGAVLTAKGIHVTAPGGRVLFQDLSLVLERERVALLGRNGAGKSTLLRVLAGEVETRNVTAHGTRKLVPQELVQADLDLPALSRHGFQLDAELARAHLPSLAQLLAREAFSQGELRKLHLISAKLQAPDLLLLDEPAQDLDEPGKAWLVDWLARWSSALVVVSHDRPLLNAFEHFFLVAESGCRYFSGTFTELEVQLEEARIAEQRAYMRKLNSLSERERHNHAVNRRRRRKKNLGRLHELGRNPSAGQLGAKKCYAQASQSRAAKVRNAKISTVREQAKALRRSLAVALPLHLTMPSLPAPNGLAIVTTENIGVVRDGRSLFEKGTFKVERERIAITGPNGAGKSTLLQVLVGEQTPTSGRCATRSARIGVIHQGASNWKLDASLLSVLMDTSKLPSAEAVASVLVAHKFPLALAERSLRSLSPGERVRAALICLCQRDPAPELLVLDEPTNNLDIAAASALADALLRWPGGIIIASHDRNLLDSIGIDGEIGLGSEDKVLKRKSKARENEPHG